MWFHIGRCSAFLLVTCFTVSYFPTSVSSQHDLSEELYDDVIKNISQANKALQKLISDYKHLKKLYKSQSSFESDGYSNDDKYEEPHREFHKSKKIPKHPTTFDGPIRSMDKPTQMYVSYEVRSKEFPKNVSINTAEETDLLINSIKSPKNILLSQKTDLQLTSYESISQPSDETNIVTNASFLSVLEEVKSANTIFLDKDKPIVRTVGLPDEDIRLINSKPMNNDNRKTDTALRESEIVQRAQLEQGDTSGVDEKTVQHVVYAKKFPAPSIWYEIINKDKSKEIMKFPQNLDESNQELISNFKKYLHTIQNDVKSKVKHLIKVQTFKLPANVNVPKTTLYKLELDDDDHIKEVQKKTNILRNAYGSACLTLVVEKCVKACNGALKQVCRNQKCPLDFKSSFRDNSKSNCETEFGGVLPAIVSNLAPDSKHKILGKVKKRPHKMDNKHTRGLSMANDVFKDMTRNGILEAGWQDPSTNSRSDPKHKSRYKSLRNRISNTNDASHTNGFINRLNILRDRYERACQQVSSKKCTIACKLAHQITCAEMHCKKGGKKQFMKACKVQCRKVYQPMKVLSDDYYSESDYSNDDSEDDDDYKSN